MAERLLSGDTAPGFTLPSADGSTVSLKDYAGTSVVVYFYPAASTPGCTTQACDFRDNLASLAAAGYTVLGISPDGVSKLRKFADAEELTARRELSRHYVLLLKEPVADAAAVEALSTGEHEAVVRDRACHLLLGPTYEAGGVDPLRVEKLVGVATNRNYNVVTTLARKWC